jgi:phosphoglycolate phosphatase-like HAD superfamily hydrolase
VASRIKGRRLYLFDIDGTLLSTGGAAARAMGVAFEHRFGIADGFKDVSFTGRSDLAILQDALTNANLLTDDLASLARDFKRTYFRCLPGVMTNLAADAQPHAGVETLLQRLNDDPDATVSLGTGNFRGSARLKLRHYGIVQHFRFGGFGDRTTVRAGIIEQGIRAANRAVGRHGTVFVIGDTVHDVAAAKANGAVAIAVATGLPSREELAASGPDVLLDTLEDADKYLVS